MYLPSVPFWMQGNDFRMITHTHTHESQECQFYKDQKLT